jgi:hypothetical protein
VSLTTVIVLLTVRSWSEDRVGLKIEFREGQRGTLLRSSVGYSLSERTVIQSAGKPVVAKWGGKDLLLSVTPAYLDTVKAMTDLKDGSWRIMLTRRNGMPKFFASHPDARRIHDILTKSLRDGSPIWLAIQLPEFIVADARFAE